LLGYCQLRQAAVLGAGRSLLVGPVRYSPMTLAAEEQKLPLRCEHVRSSPIIFRHPNKQPFGMAVDDDFAA
jgi:hypothetical protein